MSFEVADTLDMSTPAAKRASYELLVAQVRSVLEGERDWIANMSQFSALVHQSVPHLNWAGFYLARGEELVVGPFQGKVACVRIPFARGVCGACARSREVQLVQDVHAFPGHIACDSASNSELVLPVSRAAVLPNRAGKYCDSTHNAAGGAATRKRQHVEGALPRRPPQPGHAGCRNFC